MLRSWLALPPAEPLIVIGSKNSSNSNRLVEVAGNYGCKNALLVDTANDIDWEALKNINTLGLTSGASAPERLVQEVIEEARTRFEVTVEEVTLAEENITFNIPRVLAG